MVISEMITVRNAMKQMDKTAEGMLFVVGEDNKLRGTLTDGDIRRGLLEGAKMTDTIVALYNHSSYFIEEKNYLTASVRQIIKVQKFKAIPIVDEVGVLVGYEAEDSSVSNVVTKKKLLNIPVVIMAGGKGTRMAPFTNVLPKPLIPIGEKTILELIIDEFLPFGLQDFYFTINYRGEMIRAYFDSIEKKYKVTYIKEAGFYGTAGSLCLLKPGFAKTFIVSNCDIIVKAGFADVLEVHRSSGAVLTVLSSIQHHKIPYGVIHFENGGVVTGIEEKPELSFCINTGVYVLEAECLEYIPKDSVFHMTHLMDAVMAAGKRVVTYPVNENEYIDIGQWEEYRKAVSQMAMSF